MKLLYVVHQFFPECYSGTEQYCLAAAREGRRRGDEVVVLSLDPDFNRPRVPLLVHDKPYDDFRVLRLRHWWAIQPNETRRDYENPLVAARFAQILRELAPDAVHFFHLRRLGADLIEAARDVGVRSVVHLMDYWYVCPRFTLLRRDGTLCEGPPDGGLGCVPCYSPELEHLVATPETRQLAASFAQSKMRRTLQGHPPGRLVALLQRKDTLMRQLARADAVIAPSRFLAAMFERNGFPRDRIRVVPYGLEPGRVTRADVARPRSPLRVGFCGVLSPWKGPHLAVEAARQVPGPLTLTLHGRTDENEFADYIRGVMAKAQDDPRITFAGEYGADRLSAVLAELDLLVVPSTWYENTPFVILEALEAGLPVAAADLGGMAEIIDEGRNGFLFKSDDPSSLAAILRRCLEEPNLLTGLKPEPPGSIATNYDRFREAYSTP
ncbi:MAG: glycosyltransferase family 4 protein [Planctomycetota bacterium]